MGVMASVSTDYGTTPSVPPVASGTLPPLANGDRLDAKEFLRRYEAMPHVHDAELVEGVVYMPSPVSVDHCEPHFDFNGLLFVYRAQTKGVVGGDNGTLQLDLENVPQPEAYLRILAEAGGQAKVEGKYVVGAPEFVAEVALTSASYDLHDKLRAYRRNGVQEYVVWRVWDKAVDWFARREGRFELQQPGEGGIYRSGVLPGLWLDTGAVLAGDLAKALAVLEQGLASEEHQKFLSELEKRLAK
jgi:Uma2 family endonuclease